ncbi:WD40-repeat-containing domain protein [Suillus subluteus]|nr:WD40-repeat-containing domain protein [Suillus subluteus]
MTTWSHPYPQSDRSEVTVIWYKKWYSRKTGINSKLSTSDDETVRIWDVATGKQETSLEGHASRTVGLAVSMDGRKIVSGAKDGKIIIRDADMKEIIRCLSDHTDWRLVSTSSDGTLKIWDAETGGLVFDIDDHQGQVGTVAYSPDGTMIASGSVDCTIRIWNAATGKRQTQPLFHDTAVRSIVWSPDGPRLIPACNDGQIYFWSTPTSTQLGSPLRAHSAAINLLAISRNGELIVSASRDHTARLWSTSTCKPFGPVLQHADRISTESTISVSPASNITSYIDQTSASSDLLSASSAPVLDGTEFPSETAIGSRDAATSPSPSLPPRGHSNREIPSPLHTSPAVELPDRTQVPPETINSRDAAAISSPSFSPRGSSHPQIATTSASTPVLGSPPKSFWKRFPMLNRSAAPVDSKRWKFPRIGSIIASIGTRELMVPNISRLVVPVFASCRSCYPSESLYRIVYPLPSPVELASSLLPTM